MPLASAGPDAIILERATLPGHEKARALLHRLLVEAPPRPVDGVEYAAASPEPAEG